MVVLLVWFEGVAFWRSDHGFVSGVWLAVGDSYQAKMSVITHWKKRKMHWRKTYQISDGCRIRV